MMRSHAALRWGSWLQLALCTAAGASSHACAQPECASPDYGNPECRVIAENELARLLTGAGVEVRFQEPTARNTATWAATGLVREMASGELSLRVAGPGAFAISFEPTRPDADTTLAITLENVDPAASVVLEDFGGPVEIPAVQGTTRRSLTLHVDGPGVRWIRSARPCPPRYRLAVTADIQTNPWQFERIVDRLIAESQEAEAAGEPLVGLVIAGDLSEASRADEFDTLAPIFARLPFPVAVTAGNHDIYRPLHPQYNRNFGPGNYTFAVCDVHVAMLDTGSGTIARSVQARLPELLDRGDRAHLLAVMHHPPYPGITGAGWSREDTAAQVLVEFAAADVDLVLAGHNHALRDFPSIDVGDTVLREIIVGTAGAYQGVGVPRYGYLRLRFGEGDDVQPCFVEVEPAGLDGPAGDSLRTLEYCRD
jgi:hypothetical protein